MKKDNSINREIVLGEEVSGSRVHGLKVGQYVKNFEKTEKTVDKMRFGKIIKIMDHKQFVVVEIYAKSVTYLECFSNDQLVLITKEEVVKSLYKKLGRTKMLSDFYDEEKLEALIEEAELEEIKRKEEEARIAEEKANEQAMLEAEENSSKKADFINNLLNGDEGDEDKDEDEDE